MALYGLQSLGGHPEVLALIATLAPEVQTCKGFDVLTIGNALCGLMSLRESLPVVCGRWRRSSRRSSIAAGR